ncbi:TPA: hypothetical protein ACXNLX_004695 [Klebsiella aerogenes]
MTDMARLLASLRRRSAHAEEFGDSITFVKLEDLNALVAVIEKSKEVSGCPAGVYLQDWVKQLAAENAGLKQQEPKAWYIRMTDEVTTDSGEAKMWLGVPLVLAGIETRATDRIVAGIKADGVEEFAKYISLYSSNSEQHAINFAKQLREGADK